MGLPETKYIIHQFLPGSKIYALQPFGGGHINDTYFFKTETGSSYLLQRINHQVFKEVEVLMANIAYCLEQIRSNNGEQQQQLLKYHRSIQGPYYFKDRVGNYWRLMDFVKNAVTFERVERPEQAFEGAKAFANFQRGLLNISIEKVRPSIPDFHHLIKRFDKLKKVIQADIFDRKKEALKEIDFALSQQEVLASFRQLILEKTLPLRITHNDTKINNVLFDKNSHKGLCVIDLDTLMPGSVIYDFGDMVRTFTNAGEEDEKDLDKVYLRADIFEAICKGYFSELKGLLDPLESQNLIEGAKFMILITGFRFLTDFLEGDVYYKTSYREHNLHRCRTQLKLLQDLLKKESVLKTILDQYH